MFGMIKSLKLFSLSIFKLYRFTNNEESHLDFE